MCGSVMLKRRRNGVGTGCPLKSTINRGVGNVRKVKGLAEGENRIV